MSGFLALPTVESCRSRPASNLLDSRWHGFASAPEAYQGDRNGHDDHAQSDEIDPRIAREQVADRLPERRPNPQSDPGPDRSRNRDRHRGKSTQVARRARCGACERTRNSSEPERRPRCHGEVCDRDGIPPVCRAKHVSQPVPPGNHEYPEQARRCSDNEPRRKRPVREATSGFHGTDELGTVETVTVGPLESPREKQ